MRVHVLHHGGCFDGAASSAIFAAFYRSRIDRQADVVFVPKHHRPGDPFAPTDFNADDVAILDFRYSAHRKLGWFFDHHASAFQLAGEREHFETHRGQHHHYDQSAPSCASMLAEIVQERFGFEPRPHAELLDWAERVDSASFPDPQTPVRLEHPALRLMTFAEQNRDLGLQTRFITDLATMGFDDLAQATYVVDVLGPVLARHTDDIALLAARCRVAADVVEFDLLDQPPRAYNKFIPYFHHPGIRYVVGLSIDPDGRIKLTAGYNPWLPREAREHDISGLCERFNGGGHPFVGGASFARGAVDEALAAQRWIASVLRGEREPLQSGGSP